MNTYQTNILTQEIWLEIYGKLRGAIPTAFSQIGSNHLEEWLTGDSQLMNFHQNHVLDGFEPVVIMTSHDGVRVQGEYWVLPSMATFEVELIFERPTFSSPQSLNVKNIRRSILREFEVDTIDFKSRVVFC